MEKTSTEPAAYEATDYEAIEAAVMETERGRWFLAEFARRNRTADTAKVLAAVRRLEVAVGGDALPADFSAIVGQIEAVRAAVARAAIDAGLSSEGSPGEAATPGGDATRLASEAAAQRIRKAADHLSEIADRLKDQRPDLVSRIEQSIVQIHAAASLFDLAAQRITRLAGSLHTIESEVETLAALAGRRAASGDHDNAAAATSAPAEMPAATGDEVLFFVRPAGAAPDSAA